MSRLDLVLVLRSKLTFVSVVLQNRIESLDRVWITACNLTLTSFFFRQSLFQRFCSLYTVYFLLSYLQGPLDTPFSDAIDGNVEDQEGEVDRKHEAKDSENNFCQLVSIGLLPANHELLHQHAHQKQESLRADFYEVARYLFEHLLVAEQVG